jgi:hypothetical protein
VTDVNTVLEEYDPLAVEETPETPTVPDKKEDERKQAQLAAYAVAASLYNFSAADRKAIGRRIFGTFGHKRRVYFPYTSICRDSFQKFACPPQMELYCGRSREKWTMLEKYLLSFSTCAQN